MVVKSLIYQQAKKFEIVDSVLNHIQKENSIVFKLIVSSPLELFEVKSFLEKATNLNVTHIFKKGKFKDTIIDKEYEYLDMFQSSGIGAAIGSSSDEVKNAANYITLNSAENGGFAEAIYKFIPFE